MCPLSQQLWLLCAVFEVFSHGDYLFSFSIVDTCLRKKIKHMLSSFSGNHLLSYSVHWKQLREEVNIMIGGYVWVPGFGCGQTSVVVCSLWEITLAMDMALWMLWFLRALWFLWCGKCRRNWRIQSLKWNLMQNATEFHINVISRAARLMLFWIINLY